MNICITSNIAQTYAQYALQLNKNIEGKCVKVDDGDTFTFLDQQKQQHRIRLEGIDAPEKGMPFSKKSKELLSALLKDNKVYIVVIGYDQYKRALAKVRVRNTNVNLEMLTKGMAWHYKKHSKDEKYAKAEINARKTKIGLWQENKPMPPWSVRAYRRAGYSDAEFKILQKENSSKAQQFLQ